MLDETNTIELVEQPIQEPHISIDINDTDIKPMSDLPPQEDGRSDVFASYKPEYFYSSGGDIISHDHHLNEDGEALYRFLLAQSVIPPTYLLRILGTHKERRTRTVTVRNKDGTTSSRKENTLDTVTVIDFDFYVDCSPYIVHGPVFWSYPDDAAVYRGLMVRQVDISALRRKARSFEIGQFKANEHLRADAGLPPWNHGSDGTPSLNPEASSKTIREWVDEYAASPKLLKEFLYEKTIHGWNPTALSAVIAASIKSTSYTGTISASFNLSRNKIRIRPDNRLSRTLSSTLYKVLLIVTLVYPFIWLFKRFGKRGGGRWNVVGAAYALKHVEVLDGDGDGDGEEGGVGESRRGNERHRMLHNPRIIQTEDGSNVRVTGYREGEWFREWEALIKRCVVLRLRRARNKPVRNARDVTPDPWEALEGWVE